VWNNDEQLADVMNDKNIILAIFVERGQFKKTKLLVQSLRD
jgi:hypothetical protein